MATEYNFMNFAKRRLMHAHQSLRQSNEHPEKNGSTTAVGVILRRHPRDQNNFLLSSVCLGDSGWCLLRKEKNKDFYELKYYSKPTYYPSHPKIQLQLALGKNFHHWDDVSYKDVEVKCGDVVCVFSDGVSNQLAYENKEDENERDKQKKTITHLLEEIEMQNEKDEEFVSTLTSKIKQKCHEQMKKGFKPDDCTLVVCRVGDSASSIKEHDMAPVYEFARPGNQSEGRVDENRFDKLPLETVPVHRAGGGGGGGGGGGESQG